MGAARVPVRSDAADDDRSGQNEVPLEDAAGVGAAGQPGLVVLLAVEEPVGPADGIEDGPDGFAPDAVEPAGALFADERGETVADLADGDAAERCRDQVVDAGAVLFHRHLPHQAAAEGAEGRAPVAQAVGPAGAVVEVAVIGVVVEIDGILAAVPFPAVAEIVADRLPADVGVEGVAEVVHEGPDADVEAGDLGRGEERLGMELKGGRGRRGRAGGRAGAWAGRPGAARLRARLMLKTRAGAIVVTVFIRVPLSRSSLAVSLRPHHRTAAGRELSKGC